MSNEVVCVPFHGDVIEAVTDERGVWVPLKRPCESLGLQVHGQQEKLKKRAWATTQMICVVAGDGKDREQLCLHLDSLPMWLATIDPSRVKVEVREKLALYQKEAARVLAEHFFGRPKPTPGQAPLPVAELRQVIRAEVREALQGVGQALLPCRTMDLVDPREYVRRCWPRVEENTLRLVVRKMDTFYRLKLGRPAPQGSREDNAPLLCEREHLWLLTRAMQHYWSKEHPDGQRSLPGLEEDED